MEGSEFQIKMLIIWKFKGTCQEHPLKLFYTDFATAVEAAFWDAPATLASQIAKTI